MTGVFSGVDTTVLPLLAITAHAFAGALSLGFDFLSGLGVTNSRSAPAPSMIVAPARLIAAWTVSVYELPSSRSSESMISTDSGVSSTHVISDMVTEALSDCLDIFSTILVRSILSENVTRTVVLSRTFTSFTERSVGGVAADECDTLASDSRASPMRQKIRTIA